MNDEMLERLLAALEDTNFPINVNWNNKDLYISGLQEALKICNLELIEKSNT